MEQRNVKIISKLHALVTISSSILAVMYHNSFSIGWCAGTSLVYALLELSSRRIDIEIEREWE